ncbi:MAG: glycosyltransferase [Microbacter sp.]
MKIAAIVTSYNPDIDHLEYNINSYLPWIDHLVIWENTPREKSNLDQLIQRLQNEKVTVRTTEKNEYLALPFNKTIRWAQKEGYTHLLTMDQDSCFSGDGFGRFIEKVKTCNDDAVAIFAPNTHHTSDHESKTIYIEQGSVYTSGSIYKMEMFDKIGGFREDFAIYCLDVEMCMRARKNGYKIALFTDIYMQHFEGYKTKGLLGITINNYSAQSTYFYVRNNLLLWKIYPDDFTFSSKYKFLKYHVIFRILKIAFEKERTSKLKSLFLGLLHGMKTAV